MLYSDFIWVLWFFAAAIFIVIEILTPTFFVICFSIGALAAMVMALIAGGKAHGLQLGAFAISSFATFLSLRPLARKVKHKRTPISTNAESIINQPAYVVREVGTGNNEGEIRIRGDFWRATSVDGKIYKKDDVVVIDRIDGTLVYVRSINDSTEAMP